MIHDLDLVLSMTDAPIKSISASGISVITSYEDLAASLRYTPHGGLPIQETGQARGNGPPSPS